MKLNPLAFDQISNGAKTYEIRLYDKKRRKMKVGDKIVFSKLPTLESKIEVSVLNLVAANSFVELFGMFNPVFAGWKEEDSPDKCAEDMSKYYSVEDQKKYRVVAIEIELNEQIF